MGKVFFIFAFLLFLPFAAYALCDAGYYLESDTCEKCPLSYYCPGDDTMIQCPEDTSDWYAIFTEQGLEVISITPPEYYSWPSNGNAAIEKRDCYIDIYATTSSGTFLLQTNFIDDAYDSLHRKLWFSAGIGYYLSPYLSTTFKIWYNGVKECTNAPEYAHYTGPGTPDEPRAGGATDYNDCPWECDDGYSRRGNACVPLCGAGVRHIKTGGGLTVNLYSDRYSTPALNVRHNGAVCYGILAPGAAQNAININIAGTIYHTEN